MMQIVATGRDGVATIFKTIYLCVSVNADWQAEALCSHVVRLSVRPLPHLWTRGFENEFCHGPQGARAWNDQLWDMEVTREDRVGDLHPFGSSIFSTILINVVDNGMLKLILFSVTAWQSKLCQHTYSSISSGDMEGVLKYKVGAAVPPQAPGG